jgi:hypothetical protein
MSEGWLLNGRLAVIRGHAQDIRIRGDRPEHGSWQLSGDEIRRRNASGCDTVLGQVRSEPIGGAWTNVNQRRDWTGGVLLGRVHHDHNDFLGPSALMLDRDRGSRGKQGGYDNDDGEVSHDITQRNPDAVMHPAFFLRNQ